MELCGFCISDVLLQAWMTKYPAADLRREYPLMVLWITKNPAKTPKNVIRFIENWLKRVNASEIQGLAASGRASAKRVGEKLNVAPRPGESQEDYNRRVIAAAASTIGLRRVA
jgi:hypothetical protein